LTIGKYPVASANEEIYVLVFMTAGPIEKEVWYLDMGDSSRARLVVSGKDAKELKRLPTTRMLIARKGDIVVTVLAMPPYVFSSELCD
jgi:hypothetical protein